MTDNQMVFWLVEELRKLAAENLELADRKDAEGKYYGDRDWHLSRHWAFVHAADIAECHRKEIPWRVWPEIHIDMKKGT